ncbi:MAG: hypothetical protein ABSF83_09965 [Nitrososphaerales archaeon]
MTVPSLSVGLKAGSTVAVVASEGWALTALDTAAAEALAKLPYDLEADKKIVEMSEWEAMIEEAGLPGVAIGEGGPGGP